MEPVTLVDAENVRRSVWPNVSPDDLVTMVRGWAHAVGARAVVVFDGAAPDAEGDESVSIVGTGSESADSWIVRAANGLVRDRRPYRLVTSDRELRALAGRCADDVVGGRTFLRTLRATSGPSGPSSRAERASPA